jgi:hypothetical protein
MLKRSVTKSVTSFQWISQRHQVDWADTPEDMHEHDVSRVMYSGDQKRPVPDTSHRGPGYIRPYPRLTATMGLLEHLQDPGDGLLKAFLKIAETYETEPEKAKAVILELATKYGAFCEREHSAFQLHEIFKRNTERQEQATYTLEDSSNLLTFDGWVKIARYIEAGTILLHGLTLKEPVKDLVKDIRRHAKTEMDSTFNYVAPPVWSEIHSLLDIPTELANPEDLNTLQVWPVTNRNALREFLAKFFLGKFHGGASFTVNYINGEFVTAANCGAGSWAFLKLGEEIKDAGRVEQCKRCSRYFFPKKDGGETCSPKCRQAFYRAEKVKKKDDA